MPLLSYNMDLDKLRETTAAKGEPTSTIDAIIELYSTLNNGLLDSDNVSLGSGYSNPVGVIQAYAGSIAPQGWLLCYGQAVSRKTYASLYKIIGVTYGAGDGTTTFNVPDCRGRAMVGADNMGGVSAGRITAVWGGVLGQSGGAEKHTLIEGELARHKHLGATGSINTADESAHYHNVDPPATWSAYEAGHTHQVDPPQTYTDIDGRHQHGLSMHNCGDEATGYGLSSSSAFGGRVLVTGYVNQMTTDDGNPEHKHLINIAEFSSDTGTNHRHAVDIAAFASATGVAHKHAIDTSLFSTGYGGTDTAHNNVQPSLTINYIIKT